MSPDPPPGLRPPLVLLAAGLACACSLAGGRKPASATGDDLRAVGAGFVGSESCRECHPDQFRGWRQTRHPYQEQPAGEESVVAPFDGTPFEVDGVEMRAFRRDGAFFVRTLAPSGEMEDFRVIRTIGGFRKQRYVTRVDGHEAVLPVQWNVVGRYWKPYSSVGHETVGTERFWASLANEWAPRCSGCHTVGTRLTARSDGGFDARWTELGVGCESCHGPGSAHVTDPERPGAIVNPAGLGPEQQVDICGSCHSRGHAEPAAHGAPTRTRFPWGFLPGDRLADHYEVDRALPGQTTPSHWPDGSSRSHHQQAMDFRLDAHFLRAGMVCTDCHDPHGRPNPGETRLPARDDTLCLSCHDWDRARISEHTHHDPEDVGSTCIECHMPRIVNNAEPLELRSHTRWSPDPAAAMRWGMPDACTRCHEGRGQEWAVECLEAWR
ncbi:MAG: hypothetical protein D6702_11520 [Planctomycetota bacterium]|nr:MAG: hypothetical protein D6702_11520 [Planctomycetota bacterium]